MNEEVRVGATKVGLVKQSVGGVVTDRIGRYFLTATARSALWASCDISQTGQPWLERAFAPQRGTFPSTY